MINREYRCYGSKGLGKPAANSYSGNWGLRIGEERRAAGFSCITTEFCGFLRRFHPSFCLWSPEAFQSVFLLGIIGQGKMLHGNYEQIIEPWARSQAQWANPRKHHCFLNMDAFIFPSCTFATHGFSYLWLTTVKKIKWKIWEVNSS